jgi:TRAP-type C4-dicarboxylate transport system substrate-binding protein
VFNKLKAIPSLVAVAALAGLLMSTPVTAQSSKVLKFGYILAPDSQLGAGGVVFAEEIAKRTNGRYKIETYPNSALGGEVEMMKGIQLGTVDLAFIILRASL